MISVVLVARNEGSEWVRSTVASIGNNNHHEIVLIDDASTDNSCAGLKVAHTNKERVGAIRSRNIGADMATGDILVFFDAHVELAPDCLSQLESTVRANPDSFVTGAMGSFSSDAIVYGATIKPDMTTEYNSKVVDSVPICTSGFMACTKQLFDTIGGFDEGLKFFAVEDVEISLRLWGLGGSVVVNPAAKIKHRFKNAVEYRLADRVNPQQWRYNALRTALMHFHCTRLERIKSLIDDKDALRELENDGQFQSRLAAFQSVRLRAGGNHIIDQFGLKW